ncbi:F-box/LRR-repeat protein At4g14103-like [Durio zibethinus]|uniref:F-box/LRR-repeat protein At4g14103-like n=1 Tax=Durio zibethinus TaxID=66656 RepID=A0A6P5WQP4_DURZI|nr:F-box/LRR-repeat protein At4g14103-like [Durio zibethinus]
MGSCWETGIIMDASFAMQNAKRLKLGLEPNFEEAVKTSVLSKRWEFLWTSITKLEFTDDFVQSDEKRAEFMNFVERALLLHDSSSINTFSLTCEVPTDGSLPRINSWINAALRHNVQKMMLRLDFEHCHGLFMLPRHLFACESLKELELDFFFDLRLPSFVYFPNLKILTLSRVFFMDDNSVQQLFSSCPKLEKLDLFLCEWSSVKAVHVSAPVLEHLEIYEVAADLDTEPDCQFMIAGPRLKFFHYTGELKNDYCIFDSPLLVDAHVDVDLRLFHMNTGGQRQAAYRAHKLLRGLANVKDLHVSPRTLNVLLVAEELVACLPLFHNLNHLEVSGGTLNFASGTLLKILQNSPHLESIYFAMGIRLSALSVRDGWRLDPVPPCFLTHLKTLKV